MVCFVFVLSWFWYCSVFCVCFVMVTGWSASCVLYCLDGLFCVCWFWYCSVLMVCFVFVLSGSQGGLRHAYCTALMVCLVFVLSGFVSTFHLCPIFIHCSIPRPVNLTLVGGWVGGLVSSNGSTCPSLGFVKDRFHLSLTNAKIATLNCNYYYFNLSIQSL